MKNFHTPFYIFLFHRPPFQTSSNHVPYWFRVEVSLQGPDGMACAATGSAPGLIVGVFVYVFLVYRCRTGTLLFFNLFHVLPDWRACACFSELLPNLFSRFSNFSEEVAKKKVKQERIERQIREKLGALKKEVNEVGFASWNHLKPSDFVSIWFHFFKLHVSSCISYHFMRKMTCRYM